jgi:hypothetical protein
VGDAEATRLAARRRCAEVSGMHSHELLREPLLADTPGDAALVIG